MGLEGRLVAKYAGSSKLPKRMSLIISEMNFGDMLGIAKWLRLRRKCPGRDLLLTVRQAALEYREDGATGKRTTAPAPDRGKCCRCGGGRMVVWGRMKNLPRSSLSRGSDGILALIVWHFHVAGLYTPIYDGYCKSVRIRMRVP